MIAPQGALPGCAALMMCLSAICCAETPFAGTWVLQPQLTTYSMRALSFAIDAGTYRRSSCIPDLEVPADGKDHTVAGNSLADSISVRLPDRRTAEVAEKKSGRVVWQGRYSVSKDQKTMTLEYEDHRAAKPVSASVLFSREASASSGSHLLAGSWKAEKLIGVGAAGIGMTIQDSDDGLIVTAADGSRFDAKFDRNDYPIAGYLPGAAVHIGHRGPQIMQVNRKQNGVLVEMSLWTLSDDEQTLQLGQVDWPCQSKVTWVLHRR